MELRETNEKERRVRTGRMNSGRSILSRRVRRTATAAALLAALAGVMGGCETDSYIDPSVTGRWEMTPTVVPILDRLSAIEDEPTEYVQASQVLPGDLVPEVDQYRFGAGDAVEVRIRDFFTIGTEEPFSRVIDQRGYIDIPRLPPIRAQGKSSNELMIAIENAIRDRNISERPVVSITMLQQRKQTFSVLGSVTTPGTYFIPSPDYRLLEGLTTAGSVNENIPFIYVIRQAALTDAAAGNIPEPEPTRRSRPGRPATDIRPQSTPSEPKKGEDLIDLIDGLTDKKPGGQPQPSPGAFGAEVPAAPARLARAEQPAIDLPDSRSAPRVAQPAGDAQSNWVYVDGQWVRSTPAGPDGASAAEQTHVTQRVIKIPTGQLLAGVADVNIVLRPGDVIRVPVPKTGLVYMTGQVQRPGPYNLPTDGRLTLLRALDAAGGLSSIGIPERVDLMRMVGNDRQATIRVNVRAIAEQTQADIYLKPDDRVNVGTNFWAVPLAVIRNGFRFAYGFGFILDRNFDDDVFGPQNNQF